MTKYVLIYLDIGSKMSVTWPLVTLLLAVRKADIVIKSSCIFLKEKVFYFAC